MYDLHRLGKIITDINKYLKELESYNIKNSDDLIESKNYNASSMVIFAILNRLIDLGSELISAEELEAPNSYKDIMPTLSKANIINKKDSETSSLNSIMSSSSEQAINKKISSAARSNSSATSDNISAKKKSDEMSEIKQSIKGFEKALGPSKNDKPETFDDKIKKILQKDLATDSDLETSLNYSQEDNDNKYQEIFSNSNITPKKDLKKDNKSSKDKQKFFNNYLQF